MSTGKSPKGLSKAFSSTNQREVYEGIYFQRSLNRGCFTNVVLNFETTVRPWLNGDRGWVHLASLNLIEWNEE